MNKMVKGKRKTTMKASNPANTVVKYLLAHSPSTMATNQNTAPETAVTLSPSTALSNMTIKSHGNTASNVKKKLITAYYKENAEKIPNMLSVQPSKAEQTTNSERSECGKFILESSRCEPLPGSNIVKMPEQWPKIDKMVIKPASFQKGRSVLKNRDSVANKSQTTMMDFFPVRRSDRKPSQIVFEEKRKYIEEAILSERDIGLEVKIFEEKGRGIVAAKNFQKGDFVVEYAGELIIVEDAKERERMYAKDENTGCFMYYFEYKNCRYCVDATKETKRLGRLLNHSRFGNLCTKTIEVAGIPRLILIAKENISVGSELTYDYGDRSKLSLLYHPWLAT